MYNIDSILLSFIKCKNKKLFLENMEHPIKNRFYIIIEY